MRAYEDESWFRELPFLALACAMHGLILAAVPALRWGGAPPAPKPSIAVEFVAQLPKMPEPTPALAPLPQAAGPVAERPAAAGPAEGGNDRPKAAVKHRVVHHRPKLSAAQRAAIALHKAQVRYQAKLVKQAKAAAQAEAARVKAEAVAAARAERAQRVAAERLAKQERIAAAHAEKARQRAEISQQLATMVDPDEKLADAPNDPSEGPVLGGAGGEAAALRDSKEAVYDVERDGYEPSSGKGSGGGGGGLSWSI